MSDVLVIRKRHKNGYTQATSRCEDCGKLRIHHANKTKDKCRLCMAKARRIAMLKSGEVWKNVCRKATIKKFGYDPHKLPTNSLLKVVVVCSDCGTHADIQYQSAKYHSGNCKVCSRRSPVTPVMITDIIDYFYAGTVSFQAGGSVHMAYYKNKKNITVRVSQIKEIFKTLGGSVYSTSELKRLCKAHILKLPKTELFKCLTWIFENRRALSKAKTPYGKPIYRVADHCGLLREIFDKLGFEYVHVGSNKSDGLHMIKKGSFYINGEWIHIG